MENEKPLGKIYLNPNRFSIIRTGTNNSWSILLKKFRSLLKFLGPAFIISVAYIDPGNFATNITGGSIFNYNLI